MKFTNALGVLCAALAVAACSKAPTEPSAPPAPPSPPEASAPAAAASTDRWLGRWQGPEGTFLEITGGSGTYRVTVQNLDGPRSFDATAAADTITFTRDSVHESIHAGNGADTGMKWLADKRDCLVVKAGEGYCRD